MQTDAGFSHGLMVCSSGPQAIWCWGLLTGSIAHVPACSLVTAVGGGDSHRISGSAAQVPACISMLRVSHGLRVCS